MNATLQFLAAPSVAARLLVCACFGVGVSGCATADDLKAGQQVVFSPSLASAANGAWSMRVQGRVFVPAEDSATRRKLIKLLARHVVANPKDPLYRSRAGAFVSDSIHEARVSIAIGDRVVALNPSDASGCFSADIALGHDEVALLARDGVVAFESLATARQSSRFRGTAKLLAPEGVIVVTDIDDTIKVTNIRDPAEAKKNTFVLPFQPVAGMPELYRAWQQAGGAQLHFHVVSAGPWQFHELLRRFTEEARFPEFSWDMRCVDIGNPKVLVKEIVIANQERLQDFKIKTIRALMTRFPQRHVVLVGDSGERDPEVYAAIVKELGDRVDAVYIRRVRNDGRLSTCCDDLFRPLNALAKLQVFEQPAELPQRLGVAR